MIKIGKAYFDDDFNWAVCPSIGIEDNRYMVVLQNGAKVNVPGVTDSMVEAAMERLGYDPTQDRPLSELLTDEQYDALMEALESGFTWVAKDVRGICCAFMGEPVKADAYFEDPEEGPFMRFGCDFGFLEEGQKMAIDDIFSPGFRTEDMWEAEENDA